MQKKLYRLENANDLKIYSKWLKHNSNFKIKNIKLRYKPLFSVIMPVYNVQAEYLREAIFSVIKQTYKNYELILIDDKSTWEETKIALKEFENYKRIKIIYREVNGNISKATNDGIRIANGEFIVFMDCDDLIEKDSLKIIAKELNINKNINLIYTDEDKITYDGKIRHFPLFKPNFSPDLYLSLLYIGHLSVYRTSIIKKCGLLDSKYDGSQDVEFTLRFLNHIKPNQILHIPYIAYHWRERPESIAYSIESKKYCIDSSYNAIKSYLEYFSIDFKIIRDKNTLQNIVRYIPKPNIKVSIIILSKDNLTYLQKCVFSILSNTEGMNYEIIVIDNGSCSENKLFLEKFLLNINATYVYTKQDFNYSKLCNIGANKAKGDFLLFLNDDIEIPNLNKNWLSILIGHASLKRIGAVGIKLLYPESYLIQHGGVFITHNGPEHMFYSLPNYGIYFNINNLPLNVVAVTGACLAIEKKKFLLIHGFSEEFDVCYNDIDLCYKLYEKGYFNVVRNDIFLYHHESLSRGLDSLSDEKEKKRKNALIKLNKLHPGLIVDPYININISSYNTFLCLKNIKTYNFNVVKKILNKFPRFKKFLKKMYIKFFRYS